MRCIRNVWRQPASLPVLADDLLEFHAARLLLLFKICGTAGRINGLTKMAKLDFFVRYPEFFEQLRRHLGKGGADVPILPRESSMIRFHYGPWDPRYYHILAYLEAKGLITVERERTTYVLRLTDPGRKTAALLEENSAFDRIVNHMGEVKTVLGGKAGSTLKTLIYEVFAKEVAERRIGEVIS